jgi:NAD(P)-dependent dehydrogenase (short-subunit alcohol dehydrogenase family)
VTQARVAVITGAASGIGRATAELFAERDHRVVVVDLPGTDLDWAAGDDRFAVVRGDVSLDATAEAMTAVALERWGRLDAAFLNAGTAGSPDWQDPSALDRFDQVMAVNVRSIVCGIRHVVPAMRHGGGGAIVATASTSGFRGDPHRWAYNASKAAVMNLVRAAAMDFGSHGIRINAIAPGPVETGMTTRLLQVPAVHHAMQRRIPLQRWGQPRELAEAVWFLASPAASFVHGAVLAVDGGLSANAGHFDLPEPLPAPQAEQEDGG